MIRQAELSTRELGSFTSRPGMELHAGQDERGLFVQWTNNGWLNMQTERYDSLTDSEDRVSELMDEGYIFADGDNLSFPL